MMTDPRTRFLVSRGWCRVLVVLVALAGFVASNAIAQQTEDDIRRFDIPQLNVVKISLPRPTIQGAAGDTDMHGASFAALLEELDVGA